MVTGTTHEASPSEGETVTVRASGRNEPDLDPGRQVGRYLVLEAIGRGGMGMVYKAADPELDRLVALKVMRPRPSRDQADSRARLLGEGQALARLSHRNVVTVYDVGTVGDRVFIALELVEGQTLRRWLRDEAPSRRAILGVFVAAGRGLAAAHDAGIVHRDFKPSNVIIADDGSPRVIDFGIACTTDLPSDEPPPSDAHHIGSDEVATRESPGRPRARTVAGTPPYMAPEQFEGGEIGPYTDQFSFCVALYEALYGERPFRRRPGGQRDWRVADPPRNARVPAHVRAALLRGLSRNRDDRHASMAPLLAELERPPPSLRIARLVARVVVPVAIAIAVFAGWSAWEHHREQQAQQESERAAAERLRGVEERIESLIAGGHVDEADDAFFAFARLDQHRGTEALTRAWLHRAERKRDQGQLDEELGAYASAYASARNHALQADALLGLARSFRRRWDWSRLRIVLDTLDRRHGGRGEVDRLRLAAHLARRDLRSALALASRNHAALDVETTAIVEALSDAKRIDRTATSILRSDLDGDGSEELLLRDGDEPRLTAVRRDPDLTPLRQLSLQGAGALLDGWSLPRGNGEPPRFLAWQATESGQRQGVLYEPSGEVLTPVFRWPENIINAAVSADLDGDGHREIYVGVGPYTRRLFELRRAGGEWRLVEAHADVNHTGSDILELLATDLDGDRRPELMVAAGPWSAYDVRVLTRRPSARKLERAARHKLGYIEGLVALDAGSPDALLVATKSDRYPSRVAFPPDRPAGRVAGTYVLRLDDAGLHIEAAQPAPAPDGIDAIGLARPLAGDVDGDGRTDIIVNIRVRDQPYALLHRRTDDGGFAQIAIGGLEVLAAVDLDRDPATELVARLPDREGLWLLGVGDRALPAAAAEPAASASPVPAVVSESGRGLERTWRRAEELVSMGLHTHAAEVFEELAVLGGSGELGHLARYRAGELWESAGRDERAAARYEEAAVGRLAIRALEAVIRCELRLHRFAEALHHTDALLGRDDLPDEARQRARTRRSWLSRVVEPAGAVALTFDGPLAVPWRIQAPQSVRRRIRSGALQVDAFGDQGLLARLPMRCTGARIRLAVEVDVQRTEWASGLSIVLRPNGARSEEGLGVGLTAWGGGGFLERQVACLGPGLGNLEGPRSRIDTPSEPATIDASVQMVGVLGETSCVVRDATGHERHRVRREVEQIPAGGDYELVIQNAAEEPVRDPLWAAAAIRRIDILGCEVETDTPPPSPNAAAHRHLVDGDPIAAHAAYEGGARTPANRIGRLISLEQQGRRAEATALVRRHLTADGLGDDPDAFTRGVHHLLRSRERAFASLVRRALGAAYYRHYMRAWGRAIVESAHRGDPVTRRSLANLLDIRHVAPGRIGPEGPAIAMRLLAARGQAWLELGQHGLARSDLELASEIGGELLDRLGDRDADERTHLHAQLGSIHRRLALVAVAAGERATAKRHASRALELAPAPELASDRLQLHPELAPLLDASPADGDAR